MTDRLTDDEIKIIRELAHTAEPRDWWSWLAKCNAIDRLLDEIEERRRIDARRLADAEQAFQDECDRVERKDGGA